MHRGNLPHVWSCKGGAAEHTPRHFFLREGLWLSAVQGRDEQDIVPALKLIGLLAFEFPVSIVYKNQDAWSTARCC